MAKHEYGLSAQVQNKIAAKRDPEMEQAVVRWIFGVLGESVPQGNYDDILRDGQVLCRFMKKIDPSFKYNENPGTIPAKNLENIGNFVKAAQQQGIRTTDIFQSNDLFDKKNLPQVMICLQALGSALQKTHPEMPAFGPKPL